MHSSIIIASPSVLVTGKESVFTVCNFSRAAVDENYERNDVYVSWVLRSKSPAACKCIAALLLYLPFVIDSFFMPKPVHHRPLEA